MIRRGRRCRFEPARPVSSRDGRQRTPSWNTRARRLTKPMKEGYAPRSSFRPDPERISWPGGRGPARSPCGDFRERHHAPRQFAGRTPRLSIPERALSARVRAEPCASSSGSTCRWRWRRPLARPATLVQRASIASAQASVIGRLTRDISQFSTDLQILPGPGARSRRSGSARRSPQRLRSIDRDLMDRRRDARRSVPPIGASVTQTAVRQALSTPSPFSIPASTRPSVPGRQVVSEVCYPEHRPASRTACARVGHRRASPPPGFGRALCIAIRAAT